MSEGEAGIARDGGVEQLEAPLEALPRLLIEEKPSPQVQIVGLRNTGRAHAEGGPFRTSERSGDTDGERPCNLRLDREHVVRVADELTRPDLSPGAGAHQFDRDAEPPAGTQQGAADEVGHAQRSSQRHGRQRPDAAQAAYGGAGRHGHPGELPEPGGDGVGQSFAQVGVAGIAGQDPKGQHRDARLRSGGRPARSAGWRRAVRALRPCRVRDRRGECRHR